MKFSHSLRSFLLTLFSAFICSFALSSQEPDDIFEQATSDASLFAILDSLHHHGQETDHFDIGQADPVLSAECEPLTTVANCVNVISGRFFQIEKDLVSTAIEPLHITRFYDSGSLYESFLGFGFGSQFPLWASDLQDGARHHYSMISEREGFMIPYKGKSETDRHGIMSSKIDPRLTKKGYTNLSRAAVSGSANFINWKAFYRSKGDPAKGFWTVRLGDGSERIYGEKIEFSLDYRIRLNFPTTIGYLLTKEIKANGNRLTYSYEVADYKPRLKKITALNRTESAVLDTLHFSYSENKCIVTNSRGGSILYTQDNALCVPRYQTFNKRKVLMSVDSSQKGKSSHYYPRLENDEIRKLAKINRANERFMEVEYEEGFSDKEGKVKRIYEPRDANNRVATYRFHYGKQHTFVWNGLNEQTCYHFDDNQRVSKIDYFDGNTVIRQDVFQWSQATGQEGWLKSKAVRLDKDLFYLKTFRYDDNGNIKQEKIYGNITGEKPECFTVEEKDSTDCYVINYCYSDDGFNLLTEKETPEGLKITYAYLKGTNLCTKELHHYDEKIQERIFRGYDENGQINKVIEDDGSADGEEDLTDVTYRRITTIESVTKADDASFGKPQQEITTILDRTNGQMIPLKRIEFGYDAKGNEVSKRFYGGQNNFCYETKKEYDSRNRLIMESNALGHQTSYKYDENNNLTEKKTEHSGKTTAYSYDRANRLIEKKESHDEGETFITTYSYNVIDQLASETDPYGHQTTYAYDRMGNQIQSIKPLVSGINKKKFTPTVTKKYNILDQMIEKKDENGFTTHFNYNIYGSPIEIIYPDDTVERFAYYPKGWLKQQWNGDGTSVTFEYDPKGRMTKKKFLDTQGSSIKEEEYHYKGPLLLNKKDGIGCITTYSYNGAGRKIEECVDQLKTTRYDYDGFGRTIRVFHQLDNEEGQYEIYAYDGLDRVVSKELQDVHGTTYAKESYHYDINGNKDEVTIWHSNDTISRQKFHYNSDGTLNWEEDPLKNRTTWNYNHKHINGLNQRVQCRSKIDPLRRPMEEADDALHRLVRRDLLLDGKRLSCTHFDYDAAGNLIQEESQVKFNGKHLRNYAVQWKYTCRGWKDSETELPDGKTTQFKYDETGRLKERIKPDGVSITYAYDSLGRLKEKKSSDGSISYTFEYDFHDNPILITDNVRYSVQKRSYDTLNRLKEEEISSGVVLKYHYDALSRLTRLDLSDGSYVLYHYDSFYLKKIERYHPNGSLAYACECLNYDWEGRLLKSISPAGAIEYTYDLLGRSQRIYAAHWHLSIDKYDGVGNLKELKQTDPSGSIEGEFQYDRFDHLTFENLNEENHFAYDCLGNCLKKNGGNLSINGLNQLMDDGSSTYEYDLNGNLKKQSNPPVTYRYDALNRLISINREGKQTDFAYDAFNRMIGINQGNETKQLVYQGMREIGSVSQDKMNEFRLMHPDSSSELTFAIELKGTPYFPVQDFRQQVCGLQKEDGSLAQWYRYTSFGLKSIDGKDSMTLFNPWRFANKREVEGLSLFTHRLYHPQLGRWLTKDPLGFEDGLNLYAYVRNNPFRYTDPDGRFIMAVPLVITIVEWSFGAAIASSPTWLPALGYTLGYTAGTALIAYSCYELSNHLNKNDDQHLDEAKDDEKNVPEVKNEDKFKFPKNPDDLLPELPRDDKGRIQTADNLRIRPEQHAINPGETHNPRHHDQHYHVETRRDPSKSTWRHDNREVIKPQGYVPGMGSGFLPGETFPGVM